MNYQLKNDKLTVTVASLGAEILSVKRGDTEYMWQRDPRYWKGTAPVLFPFCGRSWDNVYTYGDKTFEMANHGFARRTEYTAAEATDEKLVLVLEGNEATKVFYPFDFLLTVTYMLDGDTLKSTITVKNTDNTTLPFSVGLHPGFNLPLQEGVSLEDYYIEFAEECQPTHVIFSDACYTTDERRPYPVEGKKLPLRHAMFDNDAVILENIARSVTLKCDNAKRFVKFDFPDMSYMGLWHAPKTEAPYVCIEPWCSLPAMHGVIDKLETKAGLFRTAPGEVKTVSYAITFGEC